MQKQRDLGYKWKDISYLPKDQGEDKRYRRSITIAPENSKTGVGRKIVAPVGEQFERIKKSKSIGVECGKEDYVSTYCQNKKR